VSIAAISSTYCASTAGSTWIWWKSAVERGVHSPRVRDHHRLAGERDHRVALLGLGHVLEDGTTVRGGVAYVVDLRFHAAHARTLHIAEHL